MAPVVVSDSVAIKAPSTPTPTPVASTPSDKLDKHARPPFEDFQSLVAEGRVIPCEKHGPYYLDKYHDVVAGTSFGYSSDAEWKAYQIQYRTLLQNFKDAPKKGGNWNNIDITKFDAVQLALNQGFKAFGEQFDPKPNGVHYEMLDKQKQKMIEHYDGAAKKVKDAEPDIYESVMNDDAYAPFGQKCLQPNLDAGVDLKKESITEREIRRYSELYRGALSVLDPLWGLSQRTVVAASRASSSSSIPELSWGLKKLRRVKYKVSSKYENEIRKVTDMARTSIVFPTLKGLRLGLDFLLQHREGVSPAAAVGAADRPVEGVRAVLMKNRFRDPASGYCDVLVNVSVPLGGGKDGSHVCEVQLHMKTIYDAKKDGGHKAYKWFRLMTFGSEQETYTTVDGGTVTLPYKYKGLRDAEGLPMGEGRSFGGGTGGDEHYHGERQRVPDKADKRSVREGQGTFWEASGTTVYRGGWQNDVFHGEGTIWLPSGNIYSGNFCNGSKNPSECGIYWWANGQVAIVTGFGDTNSPRGPALVRPREAPKDWLLVEKCEDGGPADDSKEAKEGFLEKYNVALPEGNKPEKPELPSKWWR
jgi:hypothetical protein